MLVDRSPPDPADRVESTTNYVGGTCRHSAKPHNKRGEVIEGPDQPEPSLEAPVGLIAQVALSESTSTSLTVNFQEARTSGQPWR